MNIGGNSRYANGSRRRALRKRILAEEDVCALCGDLVDKTLKTPDPYSPEVDEIMPFSLGGDPLARSNTQLAHRICNQRKGNGQRQKPPMMPIKTPRSW